MFRFLSFSIESVIVIDNVVFVLVCNFVSVYFDSSQGSRNQSTTRNQSIINLTIDLYHVNTSHAANANAVYRYDDFSIRFGTFEVIQHFSPASQVRRFILEAIRVLDELRHEQHAQPWDELLNRDEHVNGKIWSHERKIEGEEDLMYWDIQALPWPTIIVSITYLTYETVNAALHATTFWVQRYEAEDKSIEWCGFEVKRMSAEIMNQRAFQRRIYQDSISHCCIYRKHSYNSLRKWHESFLNRVMKRQEIASALCTQLY